MSNEFMCSVVVKLQMKWQINVASPESRINVKRFTFLISSLASQRNFLPVSPWKKFIFVNITTIHNLQITCFLDSNSATSSTSAASACSLATKNEKETKSCQCQTGLWIVTFFLWFLNIWNQIWRPERRANLLSHFRLQLAAVQLEPVKIVVAFYQH